MKGKREQDILSLVALELGTKHSLGQGKGVPNVQVAIGVRVWKCHHKGLCLWIGISFKGTLLLPHLLDLDFVGT